MASPLQNAAVVGETWALRSPSHAGSANAYGPHDHAYASTVTTNALVPGLGAGTGAAGGAAVDQPDGTKIDLRVGLITKVWKHETADK